MAKVVVNIPFVVWRDGRPRYVATPAHRALGFRGEDLKHADGTWFNLGEAAAWSRRRAEEAATQRATQADGRRPSAPRRTSAYTIGDLLADWQRPALNPRFGTETVVRGKRTVKPLGTETQRFYRSCCRTLEGFDGGRVWAAPAADLTRLAARGIWERLCEQRGPASANAIMHALSAAWTWGELARKVGPSPLVRLAMASLPPRVRVGSVDEMKALIAAADVLGRPEIGDSVMMGLMTGQRQGDRLTLVEGGADLDGRLLVRQRKTGAVVLLPSAPALVERLAAARVRRRTARVRHPELIIDERTNRPFSAKSYRTIFASVRAAVVAGVVREQGGVSVCVPPPAAGAGRHPAPGTFAARVAAGAEPLVEPCPGLAGFRDQDLRDTAVTWMALAGATIPEIISVTGHSEHSATQILKHYLGRHPEMAESAIGKASAWVARKGGL